MAEQVPMDAAHQFVAHPLGSGGLFLPFAPPEQPPRVRDILRHGSMKYRHILWTPSQADLQEAGGEIMTYCLPSSLPRVRIPSPLSKSSSISSS